MGRGASGAIYFPCPAQFYYNASQGTRRDERFISVHKSALPRRCRDDKSVHPVERTAVSKIRVDLLTISKIEVPFHLPFLSPSAFFNGSSDRPGGREREIGGIASFFANESKGDWM